MKVTGRKKNKNLEDKNLYSCPRDFHSSPRDFHSSPQEFHSSPREFHSCPQDFQENIVILTKEVRKVYNFLGWY